MNAFAFDTSGFLDFLSNTRPYSLNWNETLEELVLNVIDLLLDKYDWGEFVYHLYNILPGRISPDDITEFIVNNDIE